MNSLIFNFLKRAVVIPLICAALAASVLIFAGPRAVAKTSSAKAADQPSVKALDITSYSAKSYEKFSQLQSGDFIGSIKCENIGFGEKAIVYQSSENGNIVMSKVSREPWRNGSLLLLGANTNEQFKLLHNAKIGDKFEVNYYDKSVYTYKLTKILPCEDEETLSSYLEKNRLLMCLQYNDFTDLGNKYYYQVFIAEMV